MRTSGQNPPVSVVVPTLNAVSHLPELLAWAENERRRTAFEMVFSDNGSIDGTVALLEAFVSRHDFARLTESVVLKNAAHARNVGARVARGDLLLFLDADDIPCDGWVDAMVVALRTDPFVAGRLDYVRLNTSVQSSIRKLLQADELAILHGCPLAMGANFACTRWLWIALGGQDESIDVAEDGDFSIRACRQLGRGAHFVSNAVVHYRLRSGVRDHYSQARAYGRGEALLYSRYGETPLRARVNAALFRLLSLMRALARSPMSSAGRLSISWQLGKCVGRLRGSVRYRVFFV